MAPTTTPLVSILIVTYNSEDVLPACLESIAAYPPASDWEVLVVDNASTDATLALIAERFGWVRLVDNHENLGFAAANVLAANHAKGELLLLLNPDTVVLPGSLDALIGALLADPARQVAGACLLQADGAPGTAWGDFPTLGWALANTAPLGRLGLKPRGRTRMGQTCAGLAEVTEVDWVSGAALLVRRSAWDAVGGMDPGYFLYYEETDLCRRIKQQGGSVVIVPHARIEHLEGAIVGSLSARQYLWSTQSLIRFLRRNNGLAAAMTLRMWLVAVNLLLYAISVVGAFHPRLRRERPRYAGLVLVGLGRRVGAPGTGLAR